MKKLSTLLSVCSLLFVSSASAQTTAPISTPSTDVTNVMGNTVTLPNLGAGTLDSVYNTFIQSIGNVNLTGYIAGLFWTLAAISLLWQLIQHALNRGEMTDLFATFIRWMLYTGIAWVFISPGGYMWQAFTATMFGDVAFSQGQVTPSGIVDIGIEIVTTAAKAITLMHPFTLVNAVIAIGVFLLMLSVALEFLVLMIAANIYINVGVVCLGFAGSTWTRDFAFGYFKGIFIAALQILGLIVIFKIAQEMFIAISSELIVPSDVEGNAATMWYPMIKAFIVGLAMKLLSGRVPAMLAGILSGNFAYSSGGAMGSAMAMGAGALAMGAGAISLAKAATMNKLTGSLLQGVGSGVNALGRAGLAANSAYRGGAGLRGTLGAGVGGLKSGFSEFSKAAGQSQDAVALGGATQSASASGSSGEGSAVNTLGSSQSNSQIPGANEGKSTNTDSSGAAMGEAAQSGSGGVSAPARSVSASEGNSSLGRQDNNSAAGSAASSHLQASVPGAIGKMAGVIAEGATAVGNIDTQGSQQSSPQVGNFAGDFLSRAERANNSAAGSAASAHLQTSATGATDQMAGVVAGNAAVPGNVDSQGSQSTSSKVNDVLASSVQDNNTAAGSTVPSHLQSSAEANGNMAGVVAGSAATASNLVSQGSQHSSPQGNALADDLMSNAGQETQSGDGEKPLSDRADGTVSPQGVESTGSWSQFAGRINTSEQKASPGASATSDTSRGHQANGEDSAHQSTDRYPQASKTAQRMAKGFSMAGKALHSFGGWTKKQKVGRSLAYGIGGIVGNFLSSRNITGL